MAPNPVTEGPDPVTKGPDPVSPNQDPNHWLYIKLDYRGKLDPVHPELVLVAPEVPERLDHITTSFPPLFFTASSYTWYDPIPIRHTIFFYISIQIGRTTMSILNIIPKVKS